MIDNFDRRTALGKSVADLLFGPLDQKGIHPTVVDAGARNGMFDIPDSYASRAQFIGFEPNREEYEKLVSGKTDAAMAGLVPPRFRSTTYHQTALWSEDEERTFFVTAGAGACTLMGHAQPDITGRMFLDIDDGESYGARHTEVRRTAPVRCKALSDLVETTVDYLKIDVEGAELEVLKGARRLFEQNSILFIKTEFVFTPYYETHPVLGHQHVFLDEMGLRLLDLDANHSRYARGKTRIPARADRRMIYAGDAFFVLDPDRNSLAPETLQRLATITIAFGFHSFAVSVLRDAGLLSAKDIDVIEAALAYLTPRRRLKNRWLEFPSLASKSYWRLRRLAG